jgi:hypothetical protein
MKTLSLFMSLVLFITFNASAAELMKFGTNVKKSKRVEQAKANQKKYSRNYIIQLRQAHINFLIKLENDINAGHLTSSEAQKLFDRAWEILVIGNAYAAALKDGDICFIGGRQSVIKSGLCAVHPDLKKNCPSGQLSCDPKLFGAGTCASAKSSYGGLTANCAKASESKLDQIVEGYQDDLKSIEEMRESAKTFCNNWNTTKSKPYDGCKELQDRIAQIEKAEKDRLAAIEADRLKQLDETKNLKEVFTGNTKEKDLPPPTVGKNEISGDDDQREFTTDMNQGDKYKAFTGGGADEGKFEVSCLKGLDDQPLECNVDAICSSNKQACENKWGIATLRLSPKNLNFERPGSCIKYLNEEEVHPEQEADLSSLKISENPEVLKVRACRVIASSCIPREVAKSDEEKALQKADYQVCVNEKTQDQSRSLIVGMQKCKAIETAAMNTTEFVPDQDIQGAEISCGHNDYKESKGVIVKDGGLAFDYPSCKQFYTWYTALMMSEQAMDVTNEAMKLNAGNKAQRDLQAQIAEGNGQSAGIDATKKVTISAAQAEERKAAFLVGKSSAITAQLATFKTPNNVCKGGCCELFKKKSAPDDIKSASTFFPNSGVKGIIIAKMVDANAKAAIAGMNAKALRDQAAMIAKVKEQLEFDDGTGPEGVMKFCVENPQDVRCLGPGDRRALNATNYGSQFGGANMGLGSLASDMGEDFAIDPSQGGSLGAARKPVADVGGMHKDAAAAKDVFNAPGGGGGGGGGMGGPQGGGGGGGGGGGATANRLSDDPGAESEGKKENPIEINKKTATLEGGKAYTGGGWRAGSNNKKDAVAANPFASMFGKKQGRDPANVPEIDKPASDLFAKISHRYGEVQKRKGLLEFGAEGADGEKAKDGLR